MANKLSFIFIFLAFFTFTCGITLHVSLNDLNHMAIIGIILMGVGSIVSPIVFLWSKTEPITKVKYIFSIIHISPFCLGIIFLLCSDLKNYGIVLMSSGAIMISILPGILNQLNKKT